MNKDNAEKTNLAQTAKVDESKKKSTQYSTDTNVDNNVSDLGEPVLYTYVSRTPNVVREDTISDYNSNINSLSGMPKTAALNKAKEEFNDIMKKWRLEAEKLNVLGQETPEFDIHHKKTSDLANKVMNLHTQIEKVYGESLEIIH